jgi:hypothetical protein
MLHLWLAWAVMAVVLALAAVAVVGWLRPPADAELLDRTLVVVLVVQVVATLSGVVPLLGSGPPSDGLHPVYAAVGLVILPACRYAGRGTDLRRRCQLIVLGCALLIAVGLRLFMTGG